MNGAHAPRRSQKTLRTRQKTAHDSEERAVKREPADVKLGFDVKGMQEHEQSRSALAQRAANSFPHLGSSSGDGRKRAPKSTPLRTGQISIAT